MSLLILFVVRYKPVQRCLMRLLLGFLIFFQLTIAKASDDFCRVEPMMSSVLSKVFNQIKSHPNLKLTGYNKSTYPKTYFLSNSCCVAFDVAKEDWPFDCKHYRMICLDAANSLITQDDIQYDAWCDY